MLPVQPGLGLRRGGGGRRGEGAGRLRGGGCHPLLGTERGAEPRDPDAKKRSKKRPPLRARLAGRAPFALPWGFSTLTPPRTSCCRVAVVMGRRGQLPLNASNKWQPGCRGSGSALCAQVSRTAWPRSPGRHGGQLQPPRVQPCGPRPADLGSRGDGGLRRGWEPPAGHGRDPKAGVGMPRCLRWGFGVCVQEGWEQQALPSPSWQCTRPEFPLPRNLENASDVPAGIFLPFPASSF